MSDQKLEPFPNVMPMPNGRPSRADAPRPRRKSSNLGGDPRGDTGGAAFATLTPSKGPGSLLSVSNI